MTFRTLTDRRFVKRITFSEANATTSLLLSDTDGDSRFDMGNVDWKRFVGVVNVDTLTATNSGTATFSILTSAQGGGTGNTTDIAAVKGDGSTALATASIASATTVSIQTGKAAADGSAASNLLDNLSVLLTKTNDITAISGYVDIYAEA